MKKTRFLGVTSISFLFLIFGVMSVPEVVSAKVINWRLQTGFPASDLSTSLQAKTIVDTINERLAGRLQIKLYLPGQLVPEEEMFDALTKGVYDAAVIGPTWYTGVIPEATVAFGMPMGWRNVDQVFEFFYKFGMLAFQRKYHAKHNIFYAAPLPCSPLPVMGNFAFPKIEAIKGKKVWTGAAIRPFIARMGAVPTFFPPPELYMALKLGTIDAFIYSLAELETSGFKEVIKYINWPAIIDPLCIDLLINMNTWKKLPQDMQQTIEGILVEIGPPMFEKYRIENIKGVEAAKKAGVQEIHMGPSEVSKLEPIVAATWKEIASKSEGLAEAIQMYRDFLATKGIEIK